MLRFLSNYLFQNENQPNENDPTGELEQQQQQGPSSDKQPNDNPSENVKEGERKEEFMDLEMRDEGEDDEDDWVLIDEKNKRVEEEEGEESKKGEVEARKDNVERPEVSLVAAPSTEEEDEDDDESSEEEEDDDEEEEEEVSQGLLWENKLIEHPSMSVYVDLATSINSSTNGGVTASCVSLSSIAPATSPGESVIVLEQPDSDEEEDEDMDFLESVVHEPMPQLQKAEQVHLVDEDSDEDLSDTENNNVTSSSSVTKKPSGKPIGPIPQPPVQNGRRKKGHYPITSSNSSQMPRRAHLRNSGGSTTSASTTSFINLTNCASADSVPNGHDAIKRVKRSTVANSTAGAGVNNSACGIAMVNGAPATAAPAPPSNNGGMINKNLKLSEVFPTASAAAKRRHRRNSPPQKSGATPRGHFLQEARRRQDMQNYTKHSFANNDRRSATQRRAPKCAGAAAAGGCGGRTK